MVYPVKIYDGNGNHLRTIVEPSFDYSGTKNIRRFQAHPCPSCNDTTTNKKYCTVCLHKRRERDNELADARAHRKECAARNV